jgi:hypothetical protein
MSSVIFAQGEFDHSLDFGKVFVLFLCPLHSLSTTATEFCLDRVE